MRPRDVVMACPTDGSIMPWFVEKLPRDTHKVTFIQQLDGAVFFQQQDRHFRRFVMQDRRFFDIDGKDAHRIQNAVLLSMDMRLDMNRIRHRINFWTRNNFEDDIDVLFRRNINLPFCIAIDFPIIRKLVDFHCGADRQRRFVGNCHRHIKWFRRIIDNGDFSDIKAVSPLLYAISIPTKHCLKQT